MKRRNCLLRAISLSPTVSSKGFFPRGIKRCHYVGMGYDYNLIIWLTHNSLPRNHDFYRPFERSLLKNIVGTGEMLVTIFSFSHNVFTLSKTNFNFSPTFILSSAYAFNLDQSKICRLAKSLSAELMS